MTENQINMMNYNIEDICRTCLNDIFEKHYLFSEEKFFEEKVHLHQMLVKCTSIYVYENDGFPMYMCSNCVRDLKSAFMFQTRALKIEKFLRTNHNLIKKNIGTNKPLSRPIVDSKTRIRKRKLRKMCRICMDISKPVVFLHSEVLCNGISVFMSKMLLDCTLIYVFQGDGFPYKICSECITDLTWAYKFQQRARNAHKQLLNAKKSKEGQQLTLSVNKVENCSLAEPIKKPAFAELTNGLNSNKQEINKVDKQQYILTENLQNTEDLWNEPLQSEDDNSIDENNVNSNDSKVNATSKEPVQKLKDIFKSSRTGKHRGPPIECELCHQVFRLKSWFQTHMNMHNHVFPYECDLCPRKFHGPAFLREHLNEHEKKGEISNHEIKFPKLRTDLYKDNHDFSDYVNKMAEEALEKARQKLMNLTMTVKTPEEKRAIKEARQKAIECQLCSKQFSRIINYKYHLNSHLGIKPFACHMCTKSFPMAKHLRYHLQTHHGASNGICTEKAFLCNTCGLSYKTRHGLLKHIKNHTMERPFKCDTCTQSFTIKKLLEEHKRRHTGEKPFQCEHCDRRFVTNSNLRDHMKRKHLDMVREFVCPICLNLSQDATSLHNHMLLHNVQGDFSQKSILCHMCPGVFQNVTQLRLHMRNHTIRPYECNNCKKRFKYLGLLSLHRTKCPDLPQPEIEVVNNFSFKMEQQFYV